MSDRMGGLPGKIMVLSVGLGFVAAGADPHAGHTPGQIAAPTKGSSAFFDPTAGDFASLKVASEPEVVDLSKGEVYELKATVVQQKVGGKIFRRFAYNGSIPGPLFKVQQGKTAKIRFVNETDVETSVHSHGLRTSWKMDGQVPTSQPPVKPGESFLYELSFPDAGVFWYHPHIREDYQQDMGLMGNFWVQPASRTHWNDVDREEVIMVDDMLAKSPVVYPINGANHALMGRFGDTMLVNGKDSLKGTYRTQEVVRYFITNSANTRTFRLRFNGAKMKLVGSDLSQMESETPVDFVSIAPGERYIVEVLFPKSGTVALENSNPLGTTLLAQFAPEGKAMGDGLAKKFAKLRKNAEVTAAMNQALKKSRKQKNLSLRLDLSMSGMSGMDHSAMGHGEQGHSKMNHAAMGHSGASTAKVGKPKDLAKSGPQKDVPWIPNPSKVEWEDGMNVMNAKSDTDSIKWKMIDQDNKENMEANWILKKGNSYSVTIVNPNSGMHPMQHPIHFHGQRFFVESINGVQMRNRAWKDTALVGQGDTVKIVIEASNPGKWMAHCHISEHLTSGMMVGFEVHE